VPPPPETLNYNPLDVVQFLGGRLRGELEDYGDVKIVYDSDAYAWVMLDREGSSANALNEKFMLSLAAALQKGIMPKVAEKAVRVVVFVSQKKTFIVGADVNSFYHATDKAKIKEMIKGCHTVFDLMRTLSVPTVAAIHGSALGGGLEFTMNCGYRVASDDRGTTLGLPEIMLGVIPGAGGTVRLQKYIGLVEAATLILKGGSMASSKARKMGLVDELIPAGERWVGDFRFLHGVRTFAGKCIDKENKWKPKPKLPGWQQWLFSTIIGRSIVTNQSLKTLNKMTGGKYIAPYYALQSIMYASKTKSEKQALEYEAETFANLCVTPECKNQMSLYFLTESCKKLKEKTGFSDSEMPKINHVGVIGAGVMGAGIAHAYLNKGYKVFLTDITQEFLDKGKNFVAGLVNKAVKKKKMTKQEAKELLDKKLVTATNNLVFPSGEGKVGVIIEAAVERLDIKQKMIQDLEAAGILATNIFASNTSSLSIADLAKSTSLPGNIVGMHFFNPVDKMPLVEIIEGPATDKKAAALVYSLALKLGKFPVKCKDGPGFLVNRILGAYLAESGRLLAEKADIAKVDKLMVAFGMPMGPFRLLDEVGVDVAAHISPQLEGIDKDRFKGSPDMKKLVDSKNLGKKTGKGFFLYDEKGKSKGLNTELEQLVGYSAKKDYDHDDVVDRCVMMMANEAGYCLEEGVAYSNEDVDQGMVFGLGFAPFRGGLLSHLDHVGIKKVIERMNYLEKKYGSRFKPCPLFVKMAEEGTRFFPERPFVPYAERSRPKLSAKDMGVFPFAIPK